MYVNAWIFETIFYCRQLKKSSRFLRDGLLQNSNNLCDNFFCFFVLNNFNHVIEHDDFLKPRLPAKFGVINEGLSWSII